MNNYALAMLGNSLLISLVLTVVIECTAAFAFGIRTKKDMLLVCLVNVLTNPVVVLASYLAAYFNERYKVGAIFVLEALAIVTEAYYYKKYGRKIAHPFWLSVCLNALSYIMGVVVNRLL